MKLEVLPCSAWISGAQGQLTARGLWVSSRGELVESLPGSRESSSQMLEGGGGEPWGPGQVRESSYFISPRFLLANFPFIMCAQLHKMSILQRKDILLNFSF